MINKKSIKGKIGITSLALTLILSGCSFNLDKDNSIHSDNTTEYEDELSYEGNSKIDSIMGFKEESNNKGSTEYTHLIENSERTTATFAHIIDEKTITSNGKLFDGKQEVDVEYFGDDTIQPITLPIAFTLFGIDNMTALTESYGDCEITGKKISTLEGEIFYYLEGLFTFNSFADKYIDLGINEGDTIKADVLYRCNADGTLDLLYRTQNGFMNDSPNVLEANYNDSNEIFVNLEDTVFADMDGEYSKEYIREALDVYSGTDNFYSEENEGKDFSIYKKY